MAEEKRIYSVVAQTVQAPLEYVGVTNPRLLHTFVSPLRTEATQTIVQPAGRLIAQHGHAVSRVRESMVKKALFAALNVSGKEKRDTAVKLLLNNNFAPITTIVLAARDSAELHHVAGLLGLANIQIQRFFDTNQPDYGSPAYDVLTAIATEPVIPEEVFGILDYLPLWKP